MSIGFCTSPIVEAVSRLLLSSALLCVAVPAKAITPAYVNTEQRSEGATLRITALKDDGKGTIRGAISIDLQPGWKTYWTAPGPVGLAPRVDFSGSVGIADPVLRYPVPIRFEEGDVTSVGYAEPMAVLFEAKATGAVPRVEADIMIGICREICVPLSARLAVFPGTGLSDRALVLAAEETAPAETGTLAPLSVEWRGDAPELELGVPRGTAEAFVDAGPGWSFGSPTHQAEGGNERLTLPILSRPGGTERPSNLSVLLISGEKAQLSRSVRVGPPDSGGGSR